MHRSDWIVIGVVTGLNAVALIAIALLTLLAGPEWLEFVIVMGMVVVTLLGGHTGFFSRRKTYPRSVVEGTGGSKVPSLP